MARFYLTTAIDYANGEPHLGHALEKIGADAICRFHRQLGHDVWFLIGMDEHGQKVAQTAEKAGLAPKAFVDDIAAKFVAMWQHLGLSHDQFMRTSAAEHHAAVKDLLERIFAHSPDDFYERSYTGMYCVGCESFKQPADIVEGRCALHPTRTLEEVTERNWFFRLSKYAPALKAHFAAHPEFLQPASRRNEILALLDEGLEDVSASRARFDWGVPFPRPLSDGETQTTYVWFDALPNYWTAQFFPGSKASWPANVHVVGKDITRFHTVIWPAMLMAAGLQLPARVWAHGFISLGGERFSKSAGVKLELREAADRFGADAFRYYLLRDIPFDGDGSFSWERFEAVYTSELANGLGNLASRTIAMVEKYCEGVVPAGRFGDTDRADLADLAAARSAVDGSRGYLLHEALDAIFRTVTRANLAIQESKPWVLAKDPAQRPELERVLAALMRQLARQAVYLAPVMPGKAQVLWEALGGPGSVHETTFEQAQLLDCAGWHVAKGDGLFPRPEPPKPA
ncbi:methionine--tRNA ligase [Pseudogemmatithrix spongiicola]|uniref:Methionine--tRNA ligase n=1 Tax=Pseudogemmatithrix spongiicola TaxID=3062599 RepID=A0AA49JST1_9BACT|nr:methionine--tRNA ligase [Gemmatimonadaceae bacterium 'strain 138']WKW14180.1 methionine--tRNA ligase [Gemmatimonadaceae bacterium 'strain 318']